MCMHCNLMMSDKVHAHVSFLDVIILKYLLKNARRDASARRQPVSRLRAGTDVFGYRLLSKLQRPS
jgi:hypothetical protein